EVVSFTSTLTHTGENRQTAVLLGDVVDQFEHVDGFTDTGTAKQTDLTAFGKRADQINHLNTGFEEFDRRRKLVKFGCRLMNGATLVGLDFTALVDGTA